MQFASKINQAARWAAHKSSASVRLATGITGDVVATGINLTGGVIAVTGGVVAAVGVGTYAAGTFVMASADKLSKKAQDMTDKAYDELVGEVPAAQSEVEVHTVEDGATPCPA